MEIVGQIESGLTEVSCIIGRHIRWQRCKDKLCAIQQWFCGLSCCRWNASRRYI